MVMLLFCFILAQQYGGVAQNVSRGAGRGLRWSAGRGLRWSAGQALSMASSMGKLTGQL